MRELIAYFFGVFPRNSKGIRTGFSKGEQPTQNRFDELFNSVIFPAETKFRALVQTVTNTFNKDEVGIVTISKDADAKSNNNGLQGDHTIVPHTGQLPTVAAGPDVDYGGPGGAITSVTVAPDATATRNNFIVNITQAFFDEVLSEVFNVGVGEDNTASNVGAGEGVFKQKTGVNLELKSLIEGDGIILTGSTDEIEIKVDDVYIQSLVGGPTTGFLFFANSIGPQVTEANLIPVLTYIEFPNDSDNGSFDDGDTWYVTEWIANQASLDYIALNPGTNKVQFNFRGFVEKTGVIIDCSLEAKILKNGVNIGSQTALPLAADIDGTIYPFDISADIGTLVVGDKVELRIDGGTATGVNLVLQTGASFYNKEI